MDDVILCKVFPTSLKGQTLSWFTRLQANSTDCFETLMARFGTNLQLVKHNTGYRQHWSICGMK